MTDHTRSDDGFDPADPIVAAWAKQGDADGYSDLVSDPTALIDSLTKAHRKDQRRLIWVNFQEIIPCVLIAGFLAFSLSESEYPVLTVAAMILILAVGGFLLATTIRQFRADRRWGDSVRDQLARRLAQLNHGAWMYRNVLWWYLLPVFLSMVLFMVGSVGPKVIIEDLNSLFGLIFVPGVLVFYAVLYRVNRWLGRTRYEEEIERLEPLLAEFDRPA